jgi:hypothetical protein
LFSLIDHQGHAFFGYIKEDSNLKKTAEAGIEKSVIQGFGRYLVICEPLLYQLDVLSWTISWVVFVNLSKAFKQIVGFVYWSVYPSWL